MDFVNGARAWLVDVLLHRKDGPTLEEIGGCEPSVGFEKTHCDTVIGLAPLHAKVGQQALELDFLNSALTKAGLLRADK